MTYISFSVLTFSILATGSLDDVYGSKDEYTSSYDVKSLPYSHSQRDVGHHSTSSSSYSTSSQSLTTTPYHSAVTASRTDTKQFTKPFAPKSSTDIQVGMQVLVTRSRGEIGRGVVKYVGPLPSRRDMYIGVELGPGQGEHTLCLLCVGMIPTDDNAFMINWERISFLIPKYTSKTIRVICFAKCSLLALKNIVQKTPRLSLVCDLLPCYVS